MDSALLALDFDTILFAVTAVIAGVVAWGLSGRKQRRPDANEERTSTPEPVGRWRVFRLDPGVFHDGSTKERAVAKEEPRGGVIAVRTRYQGAWELRASDFAGHEPTPRVEIAERGVFSPRIEAQVNGKTWLRLPAPRADDAKIELSRRGSSRELKITGDPRGDEYEIRRGEHLVAIVARSRAESSHHGSVEILKTEDPLPILWFVLTLEAALPPRAAKRKRRRARAS